MCDECDSVTPRADMQNRSKYFHFSENGIGGFWMNVQMENLPKPNLLKCTLG